MRTKRLISMILCVAMIASCVFAVNFTANAEEVSAYQDMLEKTKAENKYGLAETVNEGAILQAFNWSFANITANLEKVAEQGFTTIQVSPPNEIKMPTKGVSVTTTDMSNGWWMFYQPAGFQLNESTDNALGTKAEFVAMCEKAHELGLKIIVDAVINHMGTDDDHVDPPYDNTSTDPMDHVTPRAAEFEPELLAARAFHDPWVNMTYKENYWDGYSDYDIEEDLTQHCTSGLPDLATETQLVQDTIYDYLEELVLAGADGFRFDAAKHIETMDDTYFASDFWQDTLIKLRKNYPDKECYAYGEILNKCGDGRPFDEYTWMMDVTDSSSYWGIKNAVCEGNGNAIPYYPNDNFTKQNVMQWDESHDTYIDGSTSYLTVDQRNRIWALVASRSISTCVYLARPDDTATSKEQVNQICSKILMGDAKVTSWANEATKAVNQFHNYFSKSEDEYCSGSGSFTMIERGGTSSNKAGTGAMIVRTGNNPGGTSSVMMTNNSLKSGTYIDAITGNKFTVNDQLVSGTMGATGIAVLYFDNSEVGEIEIPGPEYPSKPGCKTIVFTSNKGWSKVHYYCWATSTQVYEAAWPGNQMEYYGLNEYNEPQYIAYVPNEYDNFIINNGSGGGTNQTADLKIAASLGLYLTDINSNGNYDVESWMIKVQKQDTPTETPTEEPTIAPGIILGDPDEDGVVNIMDVTLVQQAVARAVTLEGDKFTAADVDLDGIIAIIDATSIQRFVAHYDDGMGIGKPYYPAP